jgi:hypothetical protein
VSELIVSSLGFASTRIASSQPQKTVIMHDLARRRSPPPPPQENEDGAISWFTFLSPVQNDGPTFHPL